MKPDIHPTTAKRPSNARAATPSRPSPRISDDVELQRMPPVLHGKQKLVDTGGRVERFQRRYAQRPRRALLGLGLERSPPCAR